MAAEEVETEKVMGVWDHVGELRSRLLRGLLALVATTAISVFGLSRYFIAFLAEPVGGLQNLQAIQVTESVGVYMRVALLSGFILALPIMLYQIIAFIGPGLLPHEKRWLLISIPIATLLFLAGVAFSFYVMLPLALPVLLNFLPEVQTKPTVSTYINFITSMLFWIGLSFEMPLVVFLLAKLHIVNAGMLLRQWRYAIVIIAVVSAVITPTVDMFSMALLMLPLFAIYLLSILFAFFARANSE